MIDANQDEDGLRQKYLGLYFQDDFQVTKRLNIHAGVRWEPFLPEHEVAGRGNYFSQAAFVAGQKTSLYTNAPLGLLFHGDPGIPAAYANRRYGDFAPRIGFAERFSDTFTMRGSYRIMVYTEMVAGPENPGTSLSKPNNALKIRTAACRERV